MEPQLGGFGGKWLMVRKEVQDLVMGHYLEKFREALWRRKEQRDAEWWLLVLPWVPSPKVRGRHRFSVIRKGSRRQYPGKFRCACPDASAYAACLQEN